MSHHCHMSNMKPIRSEDKKNVQRIFVTILKMFLLRKQKTCTYVDVVHSVSFNKH